MLVFVDLRTSFVSMLPIWCAHVPKGTEFTLVARRSPRNCFFFTFDHCGLKDVICNYLSGVVRLQPLQHYIRHICRKYDKSSKYVKGSKYGKGSKYDKGSKYGNGSKYGKSSKYGKGSNLR